MADYNQNNLTQISMIKTLHNTIDQTVDSPRQMAAKREHLKKRRDIVYSYQPIYYISRIFGLLPFSLRYGANGEIQMPRISKFDGIWFIVSIVIYLTLAKIVSSTIEINKNAPSPILIIGNTLLLVFGLIYGAVMIVENMCSRFRFVGILKTFIAFDKEIANVGYYFNYKKAFRHNLVFSQLMIWLPMILLCVSFSIILHFNDKCEPLSHVVRINVLYLLENSLRTAPLISFTLLMNNIRQRLAILNKYLRNRFLKKINRIRSWTQINRKDSINTVKFVGHWHNSLTDTMRLINFCFSIPVMINVGVGFLYCVWTFYSFYRFIVLKSNFYEEMIAINSIWLFYHNAFTIIILISANMIKTEGLKTCRTAHAIINCCNDADIATSLSQLSQQVQQYHPIATCGLFPFDWTLLFTMISATATYLTIMLNFESHSKYNPSRNGTA